MGRPVVHWELWLENPERSSKFYQQVFDWKIQYLPEMNYHLVETGGAGGINGGIMKPQKGPWPGKLAFYSDVALFEDPDGRVLGMWKQQK
jgi:predicted enzyme related to lactoylglutathione lyase